MPTGHDDLVLVTVDCWRTDGPRSMDSFLSRVEHCDRRDAICQAPATRGAFPALLSGLYYPQAYAGYDDVRDDVRTLPEVLSDNGYTTGAVVGSNPFLSAWEDRFEYFWNDDLTFGGSDKSTQRHLSKLETVLDYARVRPRVTAEEVATRAQAWYDRTDPPRFLWMHLMDVHVPFLPGFRRGLREGLLDVFGAHYRFMQDPRSVSASDQHTLERLYWRSMDYLDEQMDAVLSVAPDAELVVTGDHGEEFDHGECGHARLYDECIRVPLFASPGVARGVADEPAVRHLDIPVALLDSQGIEAPASWEVQSARIDPWPAFSLNHSPMFERVYASVRTRTHKVIKTFDEHRPMQRPLSVEGYDLVADPGETTNRHEEGGTFRQLERRLDEFLAREDIRDNVLERPREQSGAVEERLQALGYR